MLSREIILSCSNEKVAHAALASIGGSFAARVAALADDAGVSSGALAASAVSRFSQTAGMGEWDDLRCALVGQDQPVLAGLRHILEISLHKLDESAGRSKSGQHMNPGYGLRSCVGGTAPCYATV